MQIFFFSQFIWIERSNFFFKKPNTIFDCRRSTFNRDFNVFVVILEFVSSLEKVNWLLEWLNLILQIGQGEYIDNSSDFKIENNKTSSFHWHRTIVPDNYIRNASMRTFVHINNVDLSFCFRSIISSVNSSFSWKHLSSNSESNRMKHDNSFDLFCC